MRCLLDTNILVYAVDAADPERQARANEVLKVVGTFHDAVLSTQVLSEFANVTLRNTLLPGPDAIAQQVQRYRRLFRIFDVTPQVVLEALRGVQVHQLSYYDAQVWAVARLNEIPFVLTEDFNTGATLDGVTFQNPLDPAFDWATV